MNQTSCQASVAVRPGSRLVPIYSNNIMFAHDLCHSQIEYLRNSINFNRKDRAKRYHKSSIFPPAADQSSIWFRLCRVRSRLNRQQVRSQVRFFFGKAEFDPDVAPVCLDGPVGQTQQFGNLRGCSALPDQIGHLYLGRGKVLSASGQGHIPIKAPQSDCDATIRGTFLFEMAGRMVLKAFSGVLLVSLKWANTTCCNRSWVNSANRRPVS